MIEVQKAVNAINKNPNSIHWLKYNSFDFNYVGLVNKNNNKKLSQHSFANSMQL